MDGAVYAFVEEAKQKERRGEKGEEIVPRHAKDIHGDDTSKIFPVFTSEQGRHESWNITFLLV